MPTQPAWTFPFPPTSLRNQVSQKPPLSFWNLQGLPTAHEAKSKLQLFTPWRPVTSPESSACTHPTFWPDSAVPSSHSQTFGPATPPPPPACCLLPGGIHSIHAFAGIIKPFSLGSATTTPPPAWDPVAFSPLLTTKRVLCWAISTLSDSLLSSINSVCPNEVIRAVTVHSWGAYTTPGCLGPGAQLWVKTGLDSCCLLCHSIL